MGQRVQSMYRGYRQRDHNTFRRPTMNGDAAHTTRAQRKRIFRRDKDTCVYCGNRARVIDHVIPLWRGGKSSAENLVASCVPCNDDKGAKVGGKWAAKLATYPPVMFNAKVSAKMEYLGLQSVEEYRAWRKERNAKKTHTR